MLLSNHLEKNNEMTSIEPKIQDKKNLYREAFQPTLRIAASFISIIFHPIFLLVYSFLLLAWSNPYLFGESTFEDVLNGKSGGLLFIWLCIFSIFVPILTILMMKALGLVKDFEMTDKMDRIGPYIIVGLLYMIIFVNFNNNPFVPGELSIFSLGATIGIFTSFIINLFSKISMHTVGMGGFLAMVFIIISRSVTGNEYIIFYVMIMAGLVGTSRMLLAAHQPSDIYGGYFIGFLAQFVAMSYLLG